MRVPSIVALLGGLAFAVALGCGPKPKATESDSIALRPSPVLWPRVEPAETVTVAIFDDVDPSHQFHPTNDAERLVFHHLYRPSDADQLLGKGRYRVAQDEDFADGVIVLQPSSERDDPVLRFVDVRGRDPRDLLEPAAGIDLMILDHRAAIDYAADDNRFTEVPLAPSRFYVLLSVTRAGAIERFDSLPPIEAGATERLAFDSVRTVYARALPFVNWSHMASVCEFFESDYTARWAVPGSRRIVYDASDATARDLSERMAALAASTDAPSGDALAFARAIPGFLQGSRMVSVGLSADELAKSLRTGADFAYIVALPLEAIDMCKAVQGILAEAPWLAGRFDQKMLPLVMTRSMAFAKASGSGFSFDVRTDDAGNILVIGFDDD